VLEVVLLPLPEEQLEDLMDLLLELVAHLLLLQTQQMPQFPVLLDPVGVVEVVLQLHQEQPITVLRVLWDQIQIHLVVAVVEELAMPMEQLVLLEHSQIQAQLILTVVQLLGISLQANTMVLLVIPTIIFYLTFKKVLDMVEVVEELDLTHPLVLYLVELVVLAIEEAVVVEGELV
jgi:hypothetical protein